MQKTSYQDLASQSIRIRQRNSIHGPESQGLIEATKDQISQLNTELPSVQRASRGHQQDNHDQNQEEVWKSQRQVGQETAKYFVNLSDHITKRNERNALRFDFQIQSCNPARGRCAHNMDQTIRHQE